MIQLATDPRASRMDWRAAPGDARGVPADERRAPRSSHAWPFISRTADRPAAQPGAPRPGRESGGS
jgi:hypothetical protein